MTNGQPCLFHGSDLILQPGAGPAATGAAAAWEGSVPAQRRRVAGRSRESVLHVSPRGTGKWDGHSAMTKRPSSWFSDPDHNVTNLRRGVW